VGVGPEKAESLRERRARENLPLIGLPNQGHTVLKLYGQEVKIFKLGRMPAQMLIDKAGMLRHVHFGHAMTDIPPNEEILRVIQG
jgi:peroxiredoxin Q/BCP